MSQKYFGTNVPVFSGFDINAQRPLDPRTVVSTYNDLKTIPNIQLYNGLEVYVEDEETFYFYNGSVWKQRQYSTTSTITNDKLDGKSILIAGDSIAHGLGWNGGFANCLMENHPTAIIKNIARHGYTLAETDANMEIYDQLAHEYLQHTAAYDILLMDGGGNDLIQGITVGEPSLDKSTTPGDWKTTCNALDTIFYQIHSLWPTCKIFFVTLPLYSQGTAGTVPSPQDQLTFWNTLKKICTKYAVTVIDLTNNSNIVQFVPEQFSMYFHDSIHFNENGYRKISNYIENMILNNF